jgi:hypothetical protein
MFVEFRSTRPSTDAHNVGYLHQSAFAFCSDIV